MSPAGFSRFTAPKGQQLLLMYIFTVKIALGPLKHCFDIIISVFLGPFKGH